jgi:ketosteroid isomerase-like protein
VEAKRPLEVVRAWLAAIERADLAAADELLTDDVVQVEHPNALNPRGATSDRATLLRRMDQGRAVLRSQRYDLESVVVEADRVAAEIAWVGVLALPVLGKQPGDELHAKFACLFTVRDGRIARQVNFDCFLP